MLCVATSLLGCRQPTWPEQERAWWYWRGGMCWVEQLSQKKLSQDSSFLVLHISSVSCDLKLFRIYSSRQVMCTISLFLSSNHILIMQKHGLKIYLRNPSSYTPCLESGRSLLLGNNMKDNRSQISQFSKRDAQVRCTGDLYPLFNIFLLVVLW